MSKKSKKNIHHIDINVTIQQLLRSHFNCSEHDITMIYHALNNELPEEDVKFLVDAHHGKIDLPEPPRFAVEMEPGQVEHFQFTNHPLLIAHNRLTEQHGWHRGSLLWIALTCQSPMDLYQHLQVFKKAPFFQEIIEKDKRCEAER